MADPPPDVVDELYGAPPGEFIARRDAKAKELRKQDREAADAVKKLRKPSVSAVAVNRLARDHADDVESLLAAGRALRQAQLGGGDRDAMRDAGRDEREAVERLVEAAGRGLSDAVREEVRETLHAAASDDEARELIRHGVLREARRAVGFGGFGGGTAAPKRAKAARKDADAAEERRKAEADAERRAEAERRRAAKERIKAAKAALRDAERAATAAERDRDQAQKALEQAQRDVERRREDLEAAEDA
jgi:hypothetical protein